MNSIADISEALLGDVARFSLIEELEVANRDAGWNIEYRQLGRGPFAAEFRSVEADGIALVSERFMNRIQVIAEPPAGMVGLVIPDVRRGVVSALGREVGQADLICFSPGEEMEFITSDDIGDDAFFLGEEEFEGMVMDLFPERDGTMRAFSGVVHGDAGRLRAIQDEVTSLWNRGRAGAEELGDLVALLAEWAADGSGEKHREALIGNGTATHVALLARDAIEENFREPIRMADLCRWTGVGLRRMQRSFVLHFQMSPTEYIRARRMNAARRELVAGDPAADTVTSIALGCGFSHLGRFSVEYREHFGESPSATLAG